MEAYIEEIKDLWDTKMITNNGTKVRRLENALQDFLGVEHVALFSNGHMGLEGVFGSLGLQGEVITTPYTFISTTHAIVRSGLKPVFCDVEPEYMTMDPSKIEALITEQTSAIMPVHVYGNLCDSQAIEAIAHKYDLKVIYDAAHAFGVSCHNGPSVSQMGDVSVFSFHATKAFNTIEGGAVCTNDSKLARRLNLIRNFGIAGKESVVMEGFNGKMNEFQAAMGLCNLIGYEGECRLREALDRTYRQLLETVPGIRLMNRQKSAKGNYSYFPVFVEGGSERRDRLFNHLESNGIHTRKYFYPLTSRVECYKNDYSHAHHPVADKAAESVLALPIYAGLEQDDVIRICQLIEQEVKR